MKKFFSKFVRCGGHNQTQRSAISRSEGHPQRQENEEHTSEEKNNREKKLLKVDTKYCSSLIACSDFRQESREELKYNCPICFRFFNLILLTSCCENYICQFCVNDINKRLLSQTNIDFETHCPFCNNTNFHLKDVDPCKKPKRYTDSPVIIIKSAKNVSSELIKSRFQSQAKASLISNEDSFGSEEILQIGRIDLKHQFNLFRKMEKYFSTTENGNSIFLNKDQEMNVQSYSLEEIIDECCKYSQKRQFPMKNSTLFETSIEMEAIPRLPQHIICNKRYF